MKSRLYSSKTTFRGVMLATGAQRLISLYGVRPGSIAVVATSDDQGYYAAKDLLDAGIRVAAVVDLRSMSHAGLGRCRLAQGEQRRTSHGSRRRQGGRKVPCERGGGVASSQRKAGRRPASVGVRPALHERRLPSRRPASPPSRLPIQLRRGSQRVSTGPTGGGYSRSG